MFSRYTEWARNRRLLNGSSYNARELAKAQRLAEEMCAGTKGVGDAEVSLSFMNSKSPLKYREARPRL